MSSECDVIQCENSVAPTSWYVESTIPQLEARLSLCILKSVSLFTIQIIDKWKEFANSETSNLSPESKIESSQLDSDTCFVKAKTTIEAKTSISHSIFGNDCHVQQKTRCTNCVVMNHVRISEG